MTPAGRSCDCADLRPRRAFFADLGLGFTGLALGAMLQREGRASTAAWSPPDGRPHFPPRAKSVIWLFMNGGVSHMETFDPKPMITKYGGKSIAETPYADVQNPDRLKLERNAAAQATTQRNVLYPLQVGFRKHGQSGLEISDWFPHVAGHADRIAIVRSMWTTDNDHAAQTQFHTGRNKLDGDFPTLGGWVHYGLGSLNDDLPQFISIGTREYWNRKDGDYLGPAHDAVPLRIDPANPLDFGRPDRRVSRDEQRIAFRLVESLGRFSAAEYPDDPATAARIASYQLAYRMQSSVPGVVDFAGETEETKGLYGLDRPPCREFGMQLLAARRFVERGVRFIQIQHGGGGAGV
ncbi:MAG: DUF1501 domain-containing protein, partial [Planctomycetia bacterium]